MTLALVMSSVGGVGSTTVELDSSQGAWLVVTVDGVLASRRTVKDMPISWRSAKSKRKMSSTLALSLPVGSALIDTGAAQDLTGRNRVHFSSTKTV